MRSITQDHIQHNDGDLGVAGLLQNTTDAQIIIDHGMRTANRELLFSKVHRAVRKAFRGISQRHSPGQWGIGIHLLLQDFFPDHLRFIT